MTGLEISDLTDDASDGVKSAVQVAQQVDQSLDSVIKKAQKVELGTRSVLTGVKAAWKTLTRPPSNRRKSVSQLLKKRVMQLRREVSPLVDNNNSVLPEPYNTYNTNSEVSRQKTRALLIGRLSRKILSR